MADKTGIEWTDATWNPIVGCSVISPGCTNCYAMRQAARMLDGNPKSPHYDGTTQRRNFREDENAQKKNKNGKAVWTGKVALAPDHILTQPLRWKRPRAIFVNSMGDLFHESVPDEWIDRVFAIMALCPQHTFQILTKRGARMRDYCSRTVTASGSIQALADIYFLDRKPQQPVTVKWPLPNVWLGVSAEDQRRADERIPYLLSTPAAKRFVSCEPLLGPIDLSVAWHGESALDAECWGECLWCSEGAPPLHNCQRGLQSEAAWAAGRSGLDWIIAGGESGQGARPMHPDWARGLRDQCAEARVAFTFKQWGEWAPRYYASEQGLAEGKRLLNLSAENEPIIFADFEQRSHPVNTRRIGKRAAGRLLDGVLHDSRPPLAHERAAP